MVNNWTVIIWCLRAQAWGEIDSRNNSDPRYILVLPLTAARYKSMSLCKLSCEMRTMLPFYRVVWSKRKLLLNYYTAISTVLSTYKMHASGSGKSSSTYY